MLSFLPGFAIFAAAGLIAAAGPVVIHLLNRRRFRVLHWAAMDFLLEAIQRNRRVLQLRDLLLLLLRTACLILFGLALARPFISYTAAEADPGSAVHAVMLVDNSLSMGYEQLDETLLDRAKRKAKQFVDKLPEGSRVSVIPVCGSSVGYSLDALVSKEDAFDAIGKIELVDRSAQGAEAASLAMEASDATVQLTKRVVLLGDQQRGNWSGDALQQWRQLEDLQVVSIRPQQAENTWIADFVIQDAIADVESMTSFTAIVQHAGPQGREGVQVTLSVDGVDVATQTVDLQPGQRLPVTFDYQFDVTVSPGRPKFVPAEVSLTPDRLPSDDHRYLVVPVVAALPVLFVDQYGQTEDRNKRGETRVLRAWLAPRTSRDDDTRHLVEIRQATVEELTEQMLAEVRLVVVAGVEDPAGAVDLLREYVAQGGQLLIFAGGNPRDGEFDPADWQQSAWRDGQGILPLPLENTPLGQRNDEMEALGEKAKWFQLDFETLWHDYFILPQATREDLAALYNSAFFFKALHIDDDPEIIERLTAATQERWAENLLFLAQADRDQAEWAALDVRGQLTEAQREAWDEQRARRRRIEPAWLKWENPRTREFFVERPGSEERAEELAARIAQHNRPRVLARFNGGHPFLVERGLGQGRVVFAGSGLMPVDWNTFATGDTIVVYGRIMRSLLVSTLARRNHATAASITLPIRASERRERFVLSRPGRELVEELYPEALGPNRFGLAVRHATQRGIYTVTAYPAAESAADEDQDTKLWEIPLAVNGAAEESQFLLMDRDQLRERMTDAAAGTAGQAEKRSFSYRWVEQDEEIRLEGAAIAGEDLWWWFILAVLLLLLVEMLMLAWPQLRKEATV